MRPKRGGGGGGLPDPVRTATGAPADSHFPRGFRLGTRAALSRHEGASACSSRSIPAGVGKRHTRPGDRHGGRARRCRGAASAGLPAARRGRGPAGEERAATAPLHVHWDHIQGAPPTRSRATQRMTAARRRSDTPPGDGRESAHPPRPRRRRAETRGATTALPLGDAREGRGTARRRRHRTSRGEGGTDDTEHTRPPRAARNADAHHDAQTSPEERGKGRPRGGEGHRPRAMRAAPSWGGQGPPRPTRHRRRRV